MEHIKKMGRSPIGREIKNLIYRQKKKKIQKIITQQQNKN
jgi:hypothetical protein